MGQEIAIPLPDMEDMGPAMRALNARQQKFVVAYYHTGSRERAAMIAGYAGEWGSNLLGVSAHSVWHQPKVQLAIKEYGESSVLAGLVPMAFAALEDALTLGDKKDKLKAAQLVMDRTGFHAKSETITVAKPASRQEQIKEVIAALKASGIDPRTILGGAVDFFEADYEVVEPKAKRISANVESAPSSEGLEDLL